MGQAVENRGPELLGVDALFLVLAVISTALRCFVRLRIVKAFGMDDWFMLGATISFVFYCACSITGIHYGTGRHHADLDPKDAQRAKHYWWFCYLAYCITMIASKTSIGLFLLRITIKRVYHWIIYISMFMSIITAVVFFFVTIFQCQPVEYFWNQMEGQQGTCIKVEIIIGLAFLYSSINVIMDFSFALLPWFLIRGLQLDKKTKIALIPLLGMGCIASSAVVVRLGYLMNFKDPDFLWVTVDIAIWSTVEEGLAITAGSLATLRPLLKPLTIRLGLSKPSNLKPSGYLPGLRLPVSGDGSKVLSGSKGEAHKMSKLSQRDVEGYGGNAEVESHSYRRHLQAYPTNANQVVGRDKPLPKSRVSRSTNESQEELHNGSSIETPGQEYKGVVVTKTWFITDDRDAL